MPHDAEQPTDQPSSQRSALSGLARWSFIGAAAAVVIALDQLTKWWARTLDAPMHLIGSLQFNLSFNSGAAFSRFEGRGSIIGIIGIVVIVVLMRSSLSITSRTGAICLGLVLGGAAGNLIDRVAQPGAGLFGGKVTDFIDLQWWPVFNVADMALTCGGILLVLVGLFTPAPPSSGASSSSSSTPSASSSPTD